MQIRDLGKTIAGYYEKNEWVKKLLCCTLIAGIIMIVAPFVISQGYTYLCEDDFSFEGGALDAAEQYGQIRGALHVVKRYYMTWQGTYFANLVWNIVRPYVRWGMPGFHMVMIASMVTFIWSLWCAVKEICKEKVYGLFMTFLTFLCLLNMSESFNLKEIFFWYTGTVNYTWELSFAFLTLTLQLKIKKEQDKRRQWMLAGVSVITGLIGSGGSLNITAVNCAWLLIVLFLSYDEIWKKKLIMVPFLASFAGALVNACAPGNFARMALESGDVKYGVGEAIADTFTNWKIYSQRLFQEPLFILILAAAFIVTVIWNGKIVSKGMSHLRMLMVIVGVFMTQYLSAFPVVLGYRGHMNSARTAASFTMILKICFIFGVICFAQWCREQCKLIGSITLAFTAAVLIFGLVNYSEVKQNLKDGYSYNLIQELADGTIRDVYKVREATLSQIDSAPDGADVVVFANSIPSNRTMYGMGLLEDPNAFVNISAAGMFRVNSVTVYYQ